MIADFKMMVTMVFCLSWGVKQVWVEEESVSRLELNKQVFEPLTGLFETRFKAHTGEKPNKCNQCLQVGVEQTDAWTSHQPHGDHLGGLNDDDAGVNNDGDDDDNDVDNVGVNEDDDQLNPGQVCASLCHSTPWAKKNFCRNLLCNLLLFEWW